MKKYSELRILTNTIYDKIIIDTQIRRLINEYPCSKIGRVAEGSLHYRRVLPSFKRRHIKPQIDS